jgi:hypothetical protein
MTYTAICLIVMAENLEIRRRSDFQWRNLQNKFRENRTSGSNFRDTQPHGTVFPLKMESMLEGRTNADIDRGVILTFNV